jgi:hypothetical protein
MKCFIALLVFSALAIAGNRAFAQANVVENQSTYLYVDANSGSDSNAGTFSAPLKTIGAAAGKALANNVKNIGTKVFINPGVYRELVYINGNSGQTSAPITFQGGAGTVFIDGADVLTGWQSVSATEYVHSWQNTVTGCTAQSGWTGLQPITMHNEMVFVNGAPLTQILDSSDQRAGTFFVDPTQQQIHIWPPTGTNMNSAVVEVANRQQTLEVHGRSNLVFRGLVFRHAASCINKASASVFSSSNILFDKVQANWNNWGGIEVSTSNQITVQNSVGSYNGGVGLSSFESQNALYQYNETDYNNWRGAMGSFYNFGQGGTKLMRMHGGQIIQHFSYRNQAQGLWFDTDNKNITISNARLSENTLSNLQLEASEGPVVLANSSLCSSAIGANVINTAGLTITGNNFYNNGGTARWEAQLFLAGNPGGRSISDWQTGQPYNLFTSNTTLANNVFTDGGPGQYLFSTYTSGNDWAQFANSLHSTLNAWSDSLITTAFQVPGGKAVTLSGWQNMTGQDQTSSWASSAQASRNCAVPSPTYPDFTVQVANMSAKGSAVFSMSGGAATINVQAKSYNFGAVSLSTSALPPGVSASFSTPTITSGNSVLTLRASSSAATQTIPVTVFATSGSRVHSVTVSVAIAP